MDHLALRRVAHAMAQALQGLLEISDRIDGCPQPDCKECRDTDAKLAAARAALSLFEDLDTGKGG